jgi:hypothetical protein
MSVRVVVFVEVQRVQTFKIKMKLKRVVDFKQQFQNKTKAKLVERNPLLPSIEAIQAPLNSHSSSLVPWPRATAPTTIGLDRRW